MRSHLSITAAALLLPALAFSQTPGQYETYGSSCGTVGQTFAGHNPNGSTSYGTLPNEYALPFTLANPAPVSGMGFWTSVDSAAAKKVYSVIARIYDTDTAGAPNQVLAEDDAHGGQHAASLVLPAREYSGPAARQLLRQLRALRTRHLDDGPQLAGDHRRHEPADNQGVLASSEWHKLHGLGRHRHRRFPLVRDPPRGRQRSRPQQHGRAGDLQELQRRPERRPRRASGPQRARSVELDVRPDPAAAQSLGPLRELLALGFARHHGADGGRQ
jgi:hypothetical protein